jgi:hypothetical protein
MESKTFTGDGLRVPGKDPGDFPFSMAVKWSRILLEKWETRGNMGISP